MPAKKTTKSSKDITTSDMLKGGCIGMLISITFYVLFVITFGAGDDSLRLASYFTPAGLFVGMFGGLIERLRSLKGIIGACVLSSIVIFGLLAWYLIRTR